MKITRPDLAALGLCALVVVGIVLLSAIHVGVPDVLPTLALVALSAGAGVAAQTATSGSSSTDTEAAVRRALLAFVSSDLPAPKVPAPAAAPTVETVPAPAAAA